MTTFPHPADEIVCHARANKMVDHPFFTRLTTEPANLTALWSFYANLSVVTGKVPDWLADLINQDENGKIKCLLSLFDEPGDTKQVQASLMVKLIEALTPWKPRHSGWDPQRPGKIMASQMADFFSGPNEVDIDFVVGSLIAGEIYAKQMISVLAKEVRRQDQVSMDALEWQLAHEEVESETGRTSVGFTHMVSDSGLTRVREGAMWKRDMLWTWLDGIYKAAYSGETLS